MTPKLRRHVTTYRHHYFWGFIVSCILLLAVIQVIGPYPVSKASSTCNQLYSTTVNTTNPGVGQSFTCWVETVSTTYENTTCAMSNDPTPLGSWYTNIWNICTFNNWITRSDGHPAAMFTCTIPAGTQFPYTASGYEIFGVNFGTCSNSNPPNLPYAKIQFNGSTASTPTPTPTPTRAPTQIPIFTPTPTKSPAQQANTQNASPTATIQSIPTLTPTSAPLNFSLQQMTPTPTIYQNEGVTPTTYYYSVASEVPTAYPSYVVDYHTGELSPVPSQYVSYSQHTINPVYTGGIVQPTNTVPRVTPKVIYPAPKTVLSGRQTFLVYGPKNIHADFMLQPIGTNMGSVYAGRATVERDGRSTPFTFDTANYPNGSYTIFAKFSRDDGTYFQMDPIELAFQNANATRENQIIFPSVFDPKKVPVAQTNNVQQVANTKNAENQIGLTFTGKASPNTIITLLIYSNPIVVTVKTDVNGTWTYTLEQPLDPGKHAVYAVTPTNSGTPVRSEVFNFFIAPGFAASSNNQSLVLSSAQENDTISQLIATSIMIITGSVFVLIVLFIIKLKKSEIHTS